MTSSVVIANALYELALNQNIQDKLRSEIQNSYEELTFENISAISYLNAVLKDKYTKI
jgi:cytochrome P450 family 6